MKTRRDHLVELVAGLLMSPKQGTIRQHVEEAQELLAEIEKVCPNATLVAASAGAEVYTQDAVDALVARAVAAERERCASELARVYVDLGALNGPQLTAKEVVSSGVAAIRRGGA